ncbi:MAG: preprotein translocase subunit SecE [Christensenellales bacterium]
MAKNKKIDNTEETMVPNGVQPNESAVESTETPVEVKVKESKKKDKANTDKKANNKKANKEPKKSKTKETFAELKKVTWPSFGKTMKQTGMVLSIVLIFGVVVLGINTLLGYLIKLLTNI